MNTQMYVLSLMVAVIAAAGSTWSPCSLSMLSTLTPMAERSRGHRWWSTAAWFVGGALLGGATLAVPTAGLAALRASVELDTTTVAALAAAAALLATMLDAGALRRLIAPMPHHRRQVDERWIDAFRPWVYAGGFGWQIGTGLATYIMTAAVYLVIGLAVLSGSPVWAAMLCVSFAAVRGAAMLAGAGLRDPQRLAAFHRRFEQLREPAHRLVTVALGVVAVCFAAVALGSTGVVTAGIAVGSAGISSAILLRSSRRRSDLTVAVPTIRSVP